MSILAMALMAIAPATKRQGPTIKLVEPEAYPWIPYADDAPLLDAHDFTRWCNSIGETSDLGRVALHQLAVEYCCQEMAGKVRPPEINKLFPHIKGSGWQSYRGGYVNNTRPTLYRINQYALSKG